MEDITSQATVNSSIVDSYDDITIIKYGKIISINIKGMKYKSTGTKYGIVTGLPKCKIQVLGTYLGANGTESATVFTSGTCPFMDTGETQLRSHIGTLSKLWLYLIYVED